MSETNRSRGRWSWSRISQARLGAYLHAAGGRWTTTTGPRRAGVQAGDDLTEIVEVSPGCR